jgi:hypothetical protein
MSNITTYARLPRCLTAIILGLALVASHPHPARAQFDRVNPHMLDSGSCVASLPDSAFARTAVYLTMAVRNPIPQPIPSMIANVMQAVVDRADSALGSSPPYLPNGEPRVTWHDLGDMLLLTWHRNGQLTWSILTDSGAPPRDTASIGHVVARSLAATIATGEVFLAWPRDATNDSVQFDVRFQRSRVKPDRTLEPVEAVFAIPILGVRSPWETPVTVLKQAHPVYPSQLQREGVRATVRIEFVVDTTGRADTATIRDAWPPWRPRLTGRLGKYYDEFFDAAARSIANARFAPATVAGCKVRQMVVQPFSWEIRG